MDFSVLLSIYIKENADNFNRAMQSIWLDQTVKPNQIVLVKDGAITKELDDIIKQWQNRLGDIFNVIALDKNLGLGNALNIGLKHCRNNIVARMDTDDISISDRFEKQLSILKDINIDVCGSWVGEFRIDEDNIINFRKVPQNNKDIIIFSKKRNPINHPSVMFKKSKVDLAGGYKEMLWFEDYYLWVRMLQTGSSVYNIQEPLLNMRVGRQLERRKGIKYALAEFKFQRELYNINHLNFFELIRNSLSRFLIRLMPESFIKIAYKSIRKT